MTVTNRRNLKILIKVVEALILIVTGVLAIIYSGNTNLQSVIVILVGVYLIFAGLTKIIGYYTNPIVQRKKGLVSAVFELTVGIIFCVKSTSLVNLLNDIIIWFIAIFLIVIALMFFFFAFMEFKKYKKNSKINIVEYILSVLFLTAGILMLVFQGGSNFIAFTIIIAGVLFIIAGIIKFVLLFDKK
ncbi:MAG: DUF308 domain-containing protein [Bacilli bacterium]